ncbi:hypothetical protein [Marinagarivorans algicola]|uniref:hypothetical protein n=1 Tax=Marinagarivorans algicola TaxID=1513270 RepID=UPI0012E23530|nr:hypothetical protein [Marinagarivorans algicola]
MFKFLTFILGVLLSYSLSAGEWSGGGKITKILTKPSRNGIYFQHEKMINDGCASSSYYFLDAEQNLFKETYSLLLSAYASGKSINLLISGCQINHNYPLIVEVSGS